MMTRTTTDRTNDARRRATRRLLRGGVTFLAAWALVATLGRGLDSFAQQPPRQQHPQSRPGPDAGVKPIFTEEREAAALMFVKRNRPELLAVLEQLKSRSAEEYRRTIGDLFATSERLTAVRQSDPDGHELAVKAWKAETQTHLLAAQLASGDIDDRERVETELREAVGRLVDLRVEEAEYRVRKLESHLERARRQVEELRTRRQEMINQRFEAIRGAIRQDGGSVAAIRQLFRSLGQDRAAPETLRRKIQSLHRLAETRTQRGESLDPVARVVSQLAPLLERERFEEAEKVVDKGLEKLRSTKESGER